MSRSSSSTRRRHQASAPSNYTVLPPLLASGHGSGRLLRLRTVALDRFLSDIKGGEGDGEAESHLGTPSSTTLCA